jgi:hypothetical protein
MNVYLILPRPGTNMLPVRKCDTFISNQPREIPVHKLVANAFKLNYEFIWSKLNLGHFHLRLTPLFSRIQSLRKGKPSK